jgi:hypothetical protein
MNTPLQRRAGPKGLALQRKETGTNPTLQRHEDDELKDMDEG